LATQGAVAYDASLRAEVLMMVVPFSFLGDSPMQAELANAPCPGLSLNPCQICPLSSPDKKSCRTQ
ncbi:hypothetical protein CROQUDRAFT_35613, partial [Cronartium quercuum f. sp. fusiforme G11]